MPKPWVTCIDCMELPFDEQPRPPREVKPKPAPKPKAKPPLCCKHCGGVVTLTVIPYPMNRKPPDRPAAADLERPM